MIFRKTSSYAIQNGSKVLYSGQLTLDDLNASYPIERVALAFYYGSLAHPPKVKRIALFSGLYLGFLLLLNTLAVR